MIRVKRTYQAWVANETLEDYSLRYAARSYRKWPSYLLANTALGGISFLALEAIGGAITLSYGFANAFPAVIVVCALIFLTSVPITYYSSRYNVDIDLLTRGAGFGYLGSTITSLIYASFTFIFFALEAAIMAQALELYFALPIVIGYVICSLIIIPIAFYGVTLINKLQLWTQPLWLVLLVLPFLFIYWKEPAIIAEWANFAGRSERGGQFDWMLFGAATGVLLSLIPQIGEQVDYLRFLPQKTSGNRVSWWISLFAAGPGWIVLGGTKILAGGLLAYIGVKAGLSFDDAVAPIHMYIGAYEYVFSNSAVALGIATLFVLLSQVKINVTNAYAGSLAWSNFFSRAAHYHPGRVVWLIFNVMIALLMMLLGVFETLEVVLSVYANLAIAWIGALVADLVVLKQLGVGPPYIEFKRAHLYNINPVGCGAMLAASILSLVAYSGALGELAQVYSAFISLLTAFVCAIAIGIATRGKYYLAREDTHYRSDDDLASVRCSICEQLYESQDMAHCPFYNGPICSLCCSLDSHCHDACKDVRNSASIDGVTVEPGRREFAQLGSGLAENSAEFVRPIYEPSIVRKLLRFAALFASASLLTAAVFALSYQLLEVQADEFGGQLPGLLLRVYAAALVLIAIVSWLVVLNHESRQLAEREMLDSMRHLEQTRQDLVQSEKLASLGGLVAGVAHEVSTPVGILVSAASFLEQRTDELRAQLSADATTSEATLAYLDDATEATRLLLSNARRAGDLIRGFKQVAVDRASDERRKFDLAQHVEQTVASLQHRLRQTNVRVELSCPADVLMDSYPGPLSQVLTNLIVNCVNHAYPDGARGKIRVEASVDEDNWVEVRCCDDGRGIPDRDLSRVFDPFFTTRRSSGGSGLGLHVAYNIVTMRLGGAIRIDSAEGKGTIVSLRIPRAIDDRQVPVRGVEDD